MTILFLIRPITAAVLLSVLLPMRSSAQTLLVGDKLPQQVWNQIPNVSGKRLVILDFWNTYCGSCMAAFPKLAGLQKQFDGDIEIVLVNNLESEEVVKNRLSGMNNRRLASGQDSIAYPKMSSIFADTILSVYFPHKYVPHHVWLDREGTVLTIANAGYTNEDYIKDFLAYGVVNKSFKDDFELSGLDPIKDPLLISGHPKLSPIFSSGLFAYQSNLGSGNSWSTDTVNNMYRRAWRNYTPLELYKRALSYVGVQTDLVIQLNDPTMFDRPSAEGKLEEWRQNHLYTYEITLPLKEKEELGIKVIQDLNTYFEMIYGIRADFQSGSTPAVRQTLVISNLKEHNRNTTE